MVLRAANVLSRGVSPIEGGGWPCSLRRTGQHLSPIWVAACHLDALGFGTAFSFRSPSCQGLNVTMSGHLARWPDIVTLRDVCLSHAFKRHTGG